jgi:hypothetical protein
MLTCDNGNAILATAPPGPPTSITEPLQKTTTWFGYQLSQKIPSKKHATMLVLCFSYQLFQHNVFWLTNYSYGWRKRWLEPYKTICRKQLRGDTHFFDVREYFSPKCFFTNFLSTGAPYSLLAPVHEAYMHSLSKPRRDLTLKKQDMTWLSNYFPHYTICLAKTSFPNQCAI